MKKRFLVLAMALCMVFALGFAFADETTETTPAYDQAKHDEVCVKVEGWAEELCTNPDHTFEPTCEEKGAECYLCPLCLKCLHKEEIDALGHDWKDVAKVDATCKEDGHEAYAYCANTLDKEGKPTEFAVKGEDGKYTKVEKYTVLPKLNHMKDGELAKVPAGEWDPDTFVCGQKYSLDAKCGLCGEVLLEKIDIVIDHEFEAVKEDAPTCVETGVKAHEECVRGECTAVRYEGKVYASINDKDLVKLVTIEALGHDLVAVNGTPGSCTEKPYYDYMDCQREGCDYKENYVEMPLPDHEYEKVPGKAATCEATGLKDTWVCKFCGKAVLKDAKGEKIVAELDGLDDEDRVIAALGHEWTTIRGVLATCTTEGLAAHEECTREGCGKVKFNSSEYAADAAENLVKIPAHGHAHEDGFEPNKLGAPKREGNEELLLLQRDMIKLGKLNKVGLIRERTDKEPTCTLTGYIATKWCPWCFEIVIEGKEIPAKGHDWELTEKGTMPTCEETGLSDLWTCKVCGETQGNEVIAARGHDLKYYAPVQADCENDGNHGFYYCVRENCNHGEIDLCTLNSGIMLIGEDAEAAVCVCKPADRPVVEIFRDKKGAIEVPFAAFIPAYEHGYAVPYVLDDGTSQFIAPIAPVDPTCYATGIMGDGEYCVLCNEITVDPTVIPMKEHTFGLVLAAHDATCTENGFKGAVLCLGGCGVAYTELENGKKEYFNFTTNEEGVVQGLEHLNIPALGHDVKDGVAQEPTCFVDGWEAGTYCARCGITLTEQVKIPAAHKWEDRAAVAPTCTESGLTAGQYCPACKTNTQKALLPLGHTYDNYVEAVKPTCTEKGHEEGLCCSVCDPDYADGKNDAWLIYPSEIPALGHTYSYVPGVYFCGAKVNYYGFFYCNVCDHGTVYDELDAGMTNVPAIADFTVTYKTGKDGKIINKLPENVIIPDAVKIEAPEHDWTDYFDRAPTCTEDGVTTARQCKACGLKESEKYRPATGHQWETVAGYAATCEKIGLKDGKKCSVCGLMTIQEIIPATGHKLVHVDAKDPTCETEGNEDGKVCENKDCDYREGAKIIEALGHDIKGVEWKVVTDENGVSIRIKRCLRCNEVAVWEPIEEAAEGKLGDANGDGYLNLADALAVLAYYGDDTTVINMKNADANLDGKVDLLDALAIVRMWVGA